MEGLKEQTRIRVSKWLEGIRYLPPIMESDYLDLREHLLGSLNRLKKEGLPEEDALDIAMYRLGNMGNIKRRLSRSNKGLLQMQRIILPAAGVLFYFLCYNFMQFVGQILFGLNLVLQHQPGSLLPVYIFIASYHLLFIALTYYLFRSGRHILLRFDWVLKPVHTLGLFIIMFILSAWNFLLTRNIDLQLENLSVPNPLYNIWGLSGYTFPLVFIACFFLLYLRYNRNLDSKYASLDYDYYLTKTTGQEVSLIPVREEQAQKYWNDGMNELYLHTKYNENEALILEMKKQGYELTQRNINWNKGDLFMKAFLRMLAGVLFYFVIYFFLTSAARFFIWFLQKISDSPVTTLKNTWTLVISGYLLVLFFSTSVFFMDKQLLLRMQKIHFNSRIFLRYLILVILLGSADRTGTYLSHVAMNRSGLNVYTQMEKIFEFLNYTFPLLICTCFLILSLRYYWDQIKFSTERILARYNTSRKFRDN